MKRAKEELPVKQPEVSKPEKLSSQMKKKAAKPVEDIEEDGANPGNFEIITSTGSTLLDLVISGNRIRGGGLPAGIVVEAAGPSQSGKTVLLAELAGTIMRNGGEAQFHDAEARLDAEFASLFGMTLPKENYYIPKIITEVFDPINNWKPKNTKIANGIFIDSLAALSTELEMDKDEGDKMGMRRAKEFSQELRKSCNIIKSRNLLVIGSNQIRDNTEKANKYSPKYVIPGGKGWGFYSSVRMMLSDPFPIVKEIEFKGKKIKQVIGIETEIQVFKTVDTPYRKAPLIIIYGYGIDDIRANLEYCKQYQGYSTYCLNGVNLSKELQKAIRMVEKDPGMIQELKDETIDLWEEIQRAFATERVKVR